MILKLIGLRILMFCLSITAIITYWLKVLDPLITAKIFFKETLHKKLRIVGTFSGQVCL